MHETKYLIVYVIRFFDSIFSSNEIKQIILENDIGKILPEDMKIIIPDSSPKPTLESILSQGKEPREEIINIINGMINSYLTPDSLYCDRPSHDDRNTKFYTYLCMAKVFLDFNCSSTT
ncbi:hypothetical protein H8356DRAFT_1672588 [Neocallimastix lanati (nom. inval.)]|nr:hypothetical protein H8356DRAFT_1672588 [Neocallimastix sp. JGI-2020a]